MADVRRLERGQTSEAVLIVPLMIGLVLVIIQVGIWAYARTIAVHSAREGATAAAVADSGRSPEDVTTGALDEAAGGVLREYSVTSTAGADTVSVTVTGQALSLIPLIELPAIEQTVSVPVEHYVP